MDSLLGIILLLPLLLSCPAATAPLACRHIHCAVTIALILCYGRHFILSSSPLGRRRSVVLPSPSLCCCLLPSLVLACTTFCQHHPCKPSLLSALSLRLFCKATTSCLCCSDHCRQPWQPWLPSESSPPKPSLASSGHPNSDRSSSSCPSQTNLSQRSVDQVNSVPAPHKDTCSSPPPHLHFLITLLEHTYTTPP